MNMQDNEMDNLFRSKLEGLEMEPSAHVWDNISREIGTPQQRKSIIPMLRVAASVAILISAGLYFMPKKQDNVEGVKGPKVAVNPVVKKQDPKADAVTSAQNNPVVNVNPVAVKTQQIASVIKHTKVQPASSVTTNVTPKTSEPVKNPVDQQQLVLIADNGNNKADNLTKGHSTAAIPDVPIVDRTVPVVKPEIIANNILSTKDGDEQPVPKKRKSTGLGGFLNKVIAAVDKRDDKIIEFTDTDEGDAITGINLGIIKVKKQK